MGSVTLVTHDHRRVYPQVYGPKPGAVVMQQIPRLQYVSQEMATEFHMDWAGRPEPMDEQWIGWKVVNQLKEITKKSLGYKFKLMPPEILWHQANERNQWSVTQMMQVPDCVTFDMYERARAHVERNLRGTKVPNTQFLSADAVLSIQKLHVGHYRDTRSTLQEIQRYAEERGYRPRGSRREIYLTPAMRCHPPETWKTIVRVDIEAPENIKED